MATTTVTRNEITWTITGNNVMSKGTYVTGDPWAVGPFTVDSISPAKTGTGATTRNGSMLNVVATTTTQGHDGRTNYDSALTVAPPISMVAGDCLVSSVSEASPHTGTTLTPYLGVSSEAELAKAGLLTCVAVAPSTTAFRPSYCAGSKFHYDTNDIDWTLLPTVITPPGIASQAGTLLPELTGAFAKGWIDHPYNWQKRSHHPWTQMEDYGRDMAITANDVVAASMCDVFGNQDRRSMLFGLIQWGIDIYGLWRNGMEWYLQGGHFHGRLLPMMIAGWLFRDSNMYKPFNLVPGGRIQEVQGTYFYSGTAWHGGKSLEQDLQIEGHEEAVLASWADPGEVTDEIYRWCCTSSQYAGTAFLLKMWGIAKHLNHWPLFSYGERWMAPLDAGIATALSTLNIGGNFPLANTITLYNPPTMSGLLSYFYTSFNNLYHHLPNVTKLNGSVAAVPGYLVASAPPVAGASYTFEIYGCPKANGVILIGPKLSSPIVLDNARLWVNPGTALASIAFVRNAYNIGIATGTVPATILNYPDVVFQAYWA